MVVEALASSGDDGADDEVSAERFAMSGAPRITVCVASSPVAVVELPSSVASVCDTSSSARAAGINHEKNRGGGMKDDGELSELSAGAGAGGGVVAGDGVAAGGGVASGVAAAPPEDELSSGTSVPVSVVDETAGTDSSVVETFSAEEVGSILSGVKFVESVDEVPIVSSDDVAIIAEPVAPESLVVAATASPICHMNVRPTFVISLDVGTLLPKNPPQKICVFKPLLNAEFSAENAAPEAMVSGWPCAFAVFCQLPRQMEG